jgi:hypothetical protein
MIKMETSDFRGAFWPRKRPRKIASGYCGWLVTRAQRAAADKPGVITNSLLRSLLCALLLSGCGAKSDVSLPELFPSFEIAVNLDGQSSQFRWGELGNTLVAREESVLRWHLDGWPLDVTPPQMELQADMPSMSHGTLSIAAIATRDEGGRLDYECSLVFVMGGTWRLVFLADDREFLAATTSVSER